MTLEEIEAKFRNNFEESYERYLKALEFIKTDELREEMKNRFLKRIEPYVNSYYHEDHIISEIKALEYFRFIHNADIEFYLQYVLENYDEETFYRFYYTIYEIGLSATSTASRICHNSSWYTGKKDKEKIIEETFRNGHVLGNTFEEEIRKCIEDVIEIEINYINECQKKSLKRETYCDNCSPYCLEKRIARKG